MNSGPFIISVLCGASMVGLGARGRQESARTSPSPIHGCSAGSETPTPTREILHRARLSPVRLSRQLTDDEVASLFRARQGTLLEWTDRLHGEASAGFPERVTAFRDGMAVHGRYRKPCPECGSPIQRIVYAENETNYCARCRTGGRLLADRALSRFLKKDWPSTLEELEGAHVASRRQGWE